MMIQNSIIVLLASFATLTMASGGTNILGDPLSGLTHLAGSVGLEGLGGSAPILKRADPEEGDTTSTDGERQLSGTGMAMSSGQQGGPLGSLEETVGDVLNRRSDPVKQASSSSHGPTSVSLLSLRRRTQQVDDLLRQVGVGSNLVPNLRRDLVGGGASKLFGGGEPAQQAGSSVSLVNLRRRSEDVEPKVQPKGGEDSQDDTQQDDTQQDDTQQDDTQQDDTQQDDTQQDDTGDSASASGETDTDDKNKVKPVEKKRFFAPGKRGALRRRVRLARRQPGSSSGDGSNISLIDL